MVGIVGGGVGRAAGGGGDLMASSATSGHGRRTGSSRHRKILTTENTANHGVSRRFLIPGARKVASRQNRHPRACPGDRSRHRAGPIPGTGPGMTMKSRRQGSTFRAVRTIPGGHFRDFSVWGGRVSATRRASHEPHGTPPCDTVVLGVLRGEILARHRPPPAWPVPGPDVPRIETNARGGGTARRETTCPSRRRSE